MRQIRLVLIKRTGGPNADFGFFFSSGLEFLQFNFKAMQIQLSHRNNRNFMSKDHLNLNQAQLY